MLRPEQRAPTCPVDFATTKFTPHALASYAELRSQAPVFWHKPTRGFLLTGYANVAAALRDRRTREYDRFGEWKTVADKAGLDHSTVIHFANFVPFIHEGRRHQQLRKAIAKAIAPYAAGHRAIRTAIDEKLAIARRNGGLDIAGDFACYLLVDILSDLMDLSEDDRMAIRPMATLSWLLGMTPSISQRETFEKEMRICIRILSKQTAKVVGRATPNLLTALFNALPEDEPDKLTATACLATVMVLMGNDALGGAISVPVHHLLSRPDGDDHPPMPQSLWADASDDAIRFASPIDLIDRAVTEDMEVAGTKIMKGEKVIMSLTSANHDPAEFGEWADEVTVRPERAAGIPFGAGSHICVGARMSRTIIKEAFAALAKQPEMRLAGQHRFGDGTIVRGMMTALPVAFT